MKRLSGEYRAMIVRLLLLVAMMAATPSATAAFRVIDSEGTLTVEEHDAPVLVYKTAPVTPPDGVDVHFTRAAYIHPLYGTRGEIVSQDFPADHYHHRGLFWTWPGGKLGDREFNIWSLEGVRPYVDRVEVAEVGERVVLELHNRWSFDETPDLAFVREHVTVVVHPAADASRAIDFTIRVQNVAEEVFSLGGSSDTDKDAGVTKGYGGFCFRPDAAYKPMVFTTAIGVQAEDALEADTPWADVSFTVTEQGMKSGVAIFQHPANPGFPHPGWIFRHYAFLGASYPHTESLTLNSGERFELRYRVFIHEGDAVNAKVAEAFDHYLRDLREN